MTGLRSWGVWIAVWILSSACGGEEASGLEKAKNEISKFIPLVIEDDRIQVDHSVWEETRYDDLSEFAVQWLKDEEIWYRKTERNADADPEEELKLKRREQGCRIRLLNALSALDEVGGRIWIQKGLGTWEAEHGQAKGFTCINQQWLQLVIQEQTGDKRQVHIQEDKELGLILRFVDDQRSLSLLMVRQPNEVTSVVIAEGETILTLAGRNFADLLRKHPAEMQVKFLRTLATVGIELPLHPLLPPVMATATTGFGEGAAEYRAKAEALIKQLGDEEAARRNEATTALIRHYPFAVRQIREAAEKSEDAELKMRLNKVIAAHPTIEKAMAFVEEKKLHEDKTYLLDLLANVPFFKASARARLAELYGKDYGDEAAQWPKP